MRLQASQLRPPSLLLHPHTHSAEHRQTPLHHHVTSCPRHLVSACCATQASPPRVAPLSHYLLLSQPACRTSSLVSCPSRCNPGTHPTSHRIAHLARVLRSRDLVSASKARAQDVVVMSLWSLNFCTTAPREDMSMSHALANITTETSCSRRRLIARVVAIISRVRCVEVAKSINYFCSTRDESTRPACLRFIDRFPFSQTSKEQRTDTQMHRKGATSKPGIQLYTWPSAGNMY